MDSRVIASQTHRQRLTSHQQGWRKLKFNPIQFTKEDLDEKVKKLEKVKEEAKTLSSKYYVIETESNVKKQDLNLKEKELQELKDNPACNEEIEKKDKELKEGKDHLPSAQAKLNSRIEEVKKKDEELESLGEKVREQEKELARNGIGSTTGPTCVYIFLDIVLRRRLPLALESLNIFKGNLNRGSFKLPPKAETPPIYTPLDSDRHKRGVDINRTR